MRLAKTFGLVALAIAAFTAVLGAGSAAAEGHPLIRLCFKAELLLCEPENRVKLDTGVLLGTQLVPGVLKGNLEEKCGSSMATAEIFEMKEEEEGLKGEITELTFEECGPCKKVTTFPPYDAELSMTEEGEEGEWNLLSKGSALLSECPFGVKCKFGSTKLEPAPIIEKNEAETETILNTNKAELMLEEGSKLICGEVGKWETKYSLRWLLLNEEDEVIGEDAVWPTLLLKGEK